MKAKITAPSRRHTVWHTLAITVLSCLLVSSAWAKISYTQEQQETIVELIEELEERHYAKHPYDDNLSSLHLDSYIDALDRSKMFFTAADIREFEKYRTVMDEHLSEGNLEAGFQILL